MSIGIIILTLLVTFFSGQRSVAICYAVGIVVAISISINDSKHTYKAIDKKLFIKRLVILALAVLALFYMNSNLVKGRNIQRKFVDYMTYYFGSTTALMGNIVEDPSSCHTEFVGYFGEKTFNGFWGTMYSRGIVSEPPADRKWISMGSTITADRAGNEYTFLCGPYIDFGFGGTLVFVIIFYACFSSIYYKLILKKDMTIKRVYITAIYLYLFAMVAMTFYQDTIRSYSRPINLLYVIYLIMFCKCFLKQAKPKEEINCNVG